MLARFFIAGGFMTTPLDPVIAQIIPLLPLRDPATMTPQSARDALRALAASRAAIPPPPVESAADRQVKGAVGPLAARVYRVSRQKSPTVVFFHGGGWVAGDLETHDRQARLLAIETGAFNSRSRANKWLPAGPPKIPNSCWTETTSAPLKFRKSAARR